MFDNIIIYQIDKAKKIMVVSAEKARQKAQARRQRILAKSAERLDVVSGLVPKDKTMNDDEDPLADDVINAAEMTMVVEEEGGEEVVDITSDAAAAAASSAVAAAENDNNPSGSSKGARRMAAMRRRRYHQNAKKKEDDDDDDNEKKSTPTTRNDGENDDVEVTAEETDTLEPTLISDKSCEQPDEEAEDDDNIDEHDKLSLQTDESTEGDQQPTKKYMGVARMRRKIIKEQKAQRIAELEASATDNPIDAAATIVTIGMTASMIREGGGSSSGVAMLGGSDLLSEVAIKTLRGEKKKKWWKLIFPPMYLVPRLVTLMLLFMAGLDVGLEPHRCNVSGIDGSGGGNLIYHVESSFTKPWEYGMGGKVRHMIGMMDAAPPTSMPTSFSREGFCVDDGVVGEECATLSTSKEKEREVKMKLLSDNDDDTTNNKDDEFAERSDEDISRPKGVSTSEFDDDDNGEKETYTPPIIDPIFQVDLDALLKNSQLPAPINFAAKFAIGFHRMWVRYLWTVPTSVLKSILYSPKTLVTSWMANPPVFLFISLLIRILGKVLVGNTPSLSEEDDENGKKSDNLDILGKIKDTAMNYATSSFPKTILVLKTLKEVVTVDMYVILCGLLVGLVTPLVKQDLGFGEVSIGGGKVMGDGEL